MKSFYEITKEIALVISGAFLAILIIPFEDYVQDNFVAILLGLTALLLYGVGLADALANLYYWLHKAINYRKKVVGMYMPYPVEAHNSTWVTSTQDLLHIFTSNKVKYQTTGAKSAFKRHSVILNPYGGTYPENDVSTLQSLEAIFEFVKGGGTYINAADIPFYYAFDSNLTRRIDTTPLAGNFRMERSFLETVLTLKLHRFVFSTEAEEGTKGKKLKSRNKTKNKELEAKRIIEIQTPEENLYSETYQIGNKFFSPVVRISFGKGYFIFSTLHLANKQLEKNLMRIIKAALKLSV